MIKKGKQCTRLQMREMAVAATVDDRTMRKFLRGEPVSPLSKERIKRGLESLGLNPKEQARR